MGYRTPDSASRAMLLNSELNRIVEILRARRVDKAILLGLLVDDNVGSASDIDLIVVEKTGRRFLQAQRDLDNSRYSTAGERFNLACFLAWQSAEKALKAPIYSAGAEAVVRALRCRAMPGRHCRPS